MEFLIPNDGETSTPLSPLPEESSRPGGGQEQTGRIERSEPAGQKPKVPRIPARLNLMPVFPVLNFTEIARCTSSALNGRTGFMKRSNPIMFRLDGEAKDVRTKAAQHLKRKVT